MLFGDAGDRPVSMRPPFFLTEPMRCTNRSFATIATIVTALVLGIPTRGAAQGTDPGIAAMKANWEGVIRFITMAAEELPEADYAYRPVASVRSFGELIGHIAGAQSMICAAALGEPQPAEDAVERSATTKAALVKALKESTSYCARAYAIPASAAGEAVTLFGAPNTKAGALALNAVHDGEHYGNIITYLRMKGMVPPSSRR
jgi:uncharacterized damage-inducible protein DinB